MSSSKELRSIRHTFFDQFEKIDSPQSLYKFQKAIAEEIIKAEKVLKKEKSQEYKWHINLLRSYCDALAWTLLHPHTIRQLAKNPSHPPSLVNQADGFKHTLESAQEYADEGIPVLISDLTNCLKISDLVLCYGPEKPALVECKCSSIPPELLYRGRSGRQLSRAIKILQYLREGKSRLFGESKPRFVIETSAEIEYTWDKVNLAVNNALNTGLGFSIYNDYDIMFACVNDNKKPKIPKEIKIIATKFEMPDIGCHLRLLEEADLLIPPPLIWPIDRICKFTLMEAEILLFHLVDIQQFTKIVTEHGRILKILGTKTNLYEHCFLVEVGNKNHKFKFSSRFIDDVVYGFQTIESTGNSIIEFAKQFDRQIPNFKKSSKSLKSISICKPEIKVVKTFKEAKKLAEEFHKGSKEIFVVMPKNLFDEINNKINQLRKNVQKSKRSKN